MKGRNTSCITIRLPDTIVKSLTEKAKKAGVSTAGEYIKAQILKSYSVITMDTNTEAQSHSVIAIPDRLKAAGLTLEGNKIVSAAKPVAPLASPGIPLYDPTKHKPGDRVLIKSPYGKRLVETVIPSIDLDGNPMP